MARSTRIYLVYECIGEQVERFPIAAFTVKHEALYIINTYAGKGELTLFGGPDGGIGNWDTYNLDGSKKK